MKPETTKAKKPKMRKQTYRHRSSAPSIPEKVNYCQELQELANSQMFYIKRNINCNRQMKVAFTCNKDCLSQLAWHRQ